jgi:hypothetical protein
VWIAEWPRTHFVTQDGLEPPPPPSPFIGWTWVTGAIKDEGTTKSCSIATLMNITSAFCKLLFSQRACGQKKHAKYYMSRLH